MFCLHFLTSDLQHLRCQHYAVVSILRPKTCLACSSGHMSYILSTFYDGSSSEKFLSTFYDRASSEMSWSNDLRASPTAPKFLSTNYDRRLSDLHSSGGGKVFLFTFYALSIVENEICVPAFFARVRLCHGPPRAGRPSTPRLTMFQCNNPLRPIGPQDKTKLTVFLYIL